MPRPAQEPPTRAARERRAIIVCLLLVLPWLIWIDVATLAPPPGWSGRSTIGHALRPEERMAFNPSYRTYEAIFTRAPNGLHKFVPEHESWDSASRALAERPAETILLTYTPSDHASGLWAVTRHDRRHIIDMSYGSALTPQERAEARGRFFEEVVRPFSHLDPEVLNRLRISDFTESRRVWRGYARNLWSLALWAALLWSLRWVPSIPRRIRAANQQRLAHARTARGQCPRCGYDLKGLTLCPECGQS